MKQSLKTCLPLGEGGCEQSEQTEGGKQGCAPFSRLGRQSPQGAFYCPCGQFTLSPKGEPRINANGSVLTVNNKLSY